MTQKDENYLLQEICRNSGMGVAAINQVLKDVYDEEFAYELNVQADKMEQFAERPGYVCGKTAVSRRNQSQLPQLCW